MESIRRSKPDSEGLDGAADAMPRGSAVDWLREREVLRRKYRPKQVRILFVGEAPPASGRFFYRGNSGLYRAVRDTFLAAFPSLSKDEFLDTFQESGCYLVDLCGEPVDYLPRGARLKVCCRSEARFTGAVRTLQPKVVVTLVRSIRTSVERALMTAKWTGVHLELPYPGRWKHHRLEFQNRLVPVLIKTLTGPRFQFATGLEN
jgi:hypothetical protein